MVGILAEIEMVRAEARVDEGKLLRPWIVDGDLPRVLHESSRCASERVRPGSGMASRGRAGRRRILGRAALRRVVAAPLVVHHRIVGVDPRVPHLLGSEVRRWRTYLVGERGAWHVLV